MLVSGLLAYPCRNLSAIIAISGLKPMSLLDQWSQPVNNMITMNTANTMSVYMSAPLVKGLDEMLCES